MTTIPTTIQERVPIPLAGPGEMTGARGITPGDLFAILKQKAVVIILLWVFFGGAGVGLFFTAWFKFPKYRAEALIECISDAPARPLTLEQARLEEDSYLRFIQSQAMFLKSYNVLSKVLKAEDVRQTRWFKTVDQKELLLELQGTLVCGAVRDTNYLRVSMATRSPSDPHVVVNTAVDIYLNEVRDRANQQYRQELDDYKRELADVRSQINTKQQQMQAFKATLPPGEAPVEGMERTSQASPLTMKLMEEQRNVTDLEMQTAELESLMQIYARPEGLAVTPQDRLAVEQDPRVAQLDAQAFALEQELSILLTRFGANHRESREMQTRLEEVNKQVEISRNTRLRELLEEKRDQVETAYYNSQHSLLMAREKLQETEARQADLDRKLGEYRILVDEMKLLVELQNRIDDYVREIERIIRERGAVRVEKAVAASAPEERSFPSLIMLPAIVLLTLALSVGLSVGLELIDTSVKTPQDVLRHLTLPLLGTIPDVDDEEVSIERVERAVLDAPQSLVTEAFRTLRSNLQFSAPAERMRTILITGPRPEGGKTTVAVNLAASLATAGRRVLLVDGNLRRPALRQFFSKLSEPGLSNILIGRATLAECVQHSELPNLDLISSGPVAPNPAELLGGDLFRNFVAEAGRGYDHTIIDSSPVLLSSDALVIASAVDGTILVYRAKQDSRGVAQRAGTLLQRAGAQVFGAVLNAARVRRGGYFREQFRAFYEYQTEAEPSGGKKPAVPGGTTPDKHKDKDESDRA